MTGPTSTIEALFDSVTPAGKKGFDAATHTDLSQIQLRAARLWLSSFAVNHRTNPPVGAVTTSQLAARLVDWATMPLVDSPAPRPGLDIDPLGFQARRRKALERSETGEKILPNDIRRIWSHPELAAERKVLPDGLLDALLPTEYWPLLVALIEEGPKLVERRLNAWLHDWAADKKESSVASQRTLLLRLFHECSNQAEALPESFSEWKAYEPSLIRPVGTDRTPRRPGNPSLREVRVAVHSLVQRVLEEAARLAGHETVSLDELLRVVHEIPAHKLQAKRNASFFSLIRNWVLLHTLWVTQARIESLEALTIGDLGVMSTGAGRGPTLAHRPRKNHPAEFVSPKPLTPLALYPLQVLEAIRERIHGEALPADWPLLPRSFSRQSEPLGKQTIGKLIAGGVERATTGTRAERYPVDGMRQAIALEETTARREGREPRQCGWFEVSEGGEVRSFWLDTRVTNDRRRHLEDSSNPIWVGTVKALLPMNGNPYEGWNPHSLRKTGSQELDTPKVTDYLTQQDFPYPQRWLSEVIHDHKRLDGTTATSSAYKGNRDVLDKVAAMAVEVLAELLYGNLGARMVIDGKRYAQALREHQALEAQATSLRAKRKELREKTRAGSMTLEQQAVEFDELMESMDLVNQHLTDVAAEIEKIETGDPRFKVALPDHLSGDHQSVDLAEIRARVLGVDEAQPLKRGRAPVRDWITGTELATLGGVSPKTARTWLRDESPVSPTSIQVFLTKRPPVIALAPGRRVIPIEFLNPAWLDQGPSRRALLERIVKDWPAENKWTSFRQESHPMPEWLEAELDREPRASIAGN
jgi:hypothetical protein